jgi:hypothetical protein
MITGEPPEEWERTVTDFLDREPELVATGSGPTYLRFALRPPSTGEPEPDGSECREPDGHGWLSFWPAVGAKEPHPPGAIRHATKNTLLFSCNRHQVATIRV